ncbi:MAG TPA: hypothetical protein VD766_01145 [Solirubrobacterales bacterium]|nr:hypothetical protein [Solirubrobacterales bacterium]
MDLIEDIGPILGIVAFLGFAILALLIVLQAREVRRLREWAGRAPERALEADEAALSASDAAPSEEAASDEPESPSRIAAFRQRVSDKVGPKWDGLDRRSPVDPRLVLGGLLIALIVAGVLTSGFGLVGDDEAPVAEEAPKKPEKVEVAVLNATQQEGVPPVSGVADLVAQDIVKSQEFAPGVKADALVGEPVSVIQFEPDAEDDAEALAEKVEKDLGPTEIVEMTDAVRNQVEGAPLALLVGADDALVGQDAAATDVVAP